MSALKGNTSASQGPVQGAAGRRGLPAVQGTGQVRRKGGLSWCSLCTSEFIIQWGRLTVGFCEVHGLRIVFKWLGKKN